MCRADHDLNVGIDRPQALNGFQSVPSRRHAHIDERQRIGSALLQRLADTRYTFLTLQRRIDLELRSRARSRRGLLAEERALRGQQVVLLFSFACEDLAKIAVNRLVIIDDEDAMTDR